MVIIKVEVTINEVNKQIFETRLNDVIQAALLLNGCLAYHWFRQRIKSNSYFVYGEFSDIKSFQDYKKSHVVKMIVDNLIPLSVSKPEYKHFEASVFEEG